MMFSNINKVLFVLIFLILFFSYINRKNQSTIGFKQFNNLLIQPGENHFVNLQQLTFSGENAEAYFSKDGSKLIFQSHDGDSLCDQIYIIDIEITINQNINQLNNIFNKII